MKEFLGLLEEFRKKDKEFVAAVNCKRVMVKIKSINGELVTLLSAESKDRYDLHYSQVVICSRDGGS